MKTAHPGLLEGGPRWLPDDGRWRCGRGRRGHPAGDPADPRSRVSGPDRLRRQGPRRQVPAHPAAAPAHRGTERAGGAAGRCGVRGLQRLRRSSAHPHGGAAGRPGPALHPVPHHGVVLADQGGPDHRPQPPLGGDGRHHRDGDVSARLQLGATEHLRHHGRDPQAERLRHRACRQVPRGPGVGDQPGRAVRPLAQPWQRLRILLRVPGRRDRPVVPDPARGDHPGRALGHPRGGLPPHRGPDRQGDHLAASAVGAHARQAVPDVLRARGHPRPPPRPQGVGGEVPRPLRPRLGPPARGDLRPPRRNSGSSPRMPS